MPRIRLESRPYDYLLDKNNNNDVNPARDNGALASASKRKAAAASHKVRSSDNFFQGPVVPILDAMPAEVILAPTMKTNPLIPPSLAHEMPTRECGMQTDFRESEVQTDPYTPGYVIGAGSQHPDPELLLLQRLKHTNVLQKVTHREVQLIDFQRKKHEIESSLPPATDEASLTLRRRILEHLELQNFKIRERDMDRKREARLAVVHQLLHERSEANEYANEQRVEALRQERLATRDANIEKIQCQRLQILRKLTKGRAEFPIPGGSLKGKKGGSNQRDVIDEYTRLSSKTYAPVARDGGARQKHLIHWIDQYNEVGLASAKLENLKELEGSLLDKMFHVDMTKTLPRAAGKDGHLLNAGASSPSPLGLNLGFHHQQQQTALQEEVTPLFPPQESAASSTLRSKKIVIERPPTPIVAEASAEEELEPHILLLQRLIRGRGEQNRMYEGKERRIQLIRELQLQGEAGGGNVTPTTEEHEQKIRDSTLESIAGTVVSNVLVRATTRQEETS